MPRKDKRPTSATLSKQSVLEALAREPKATKRDLSRLLGVYGNDRIALKRILKELEHEGEISRGRKRAFTKAGTLPDVLVLEITGQDNDGELLARPQKWDGAEAPPQIVVMPGREGDAPGKGERVLARLSPAQDGYEARIIKRLGASVHKVLGVYRQSAREGRIVPIDRKTQIRIHRRCARSQRCRAQRVGAGRAVIGPRFRFAARTRGGAAGQHGCAQGREPYRHSCARHSDGIPQRYAG